MNKIIISFCVLAICYGCKVNKEKSEWLLEDRQTQSRLETSTSWMEFNSQDSSYRYWYYTGDSSFFFHPDSGLRARKGTMYMEDHHALRRYHTSGADRSNSALRVRDQSHTEKNSRLSYSTGKIIGVAVVIIILAIFFISKKLL